MLCRVVRPSLAIRALTRAKRTVQGASDKRHTYHIAAGQRLLRTFGSFREIPGETPVLKETLSSGIGGKPPVPTTDIV
jgi:hypothetical protein